MRRTNPNRLKIWSELMNNAIQGLEPAPVWKYFSEICRIPRCSKHEEAMTAYILQQAKALGLEAESDTFGNVVVRKPASPGREGRPSVVLQGHLDMVCEKNKDKVHDFSSDPIELVLKRNLLMANGTTLGADNGIAVAVNLAIMEDRTLEHGPLEFLFTVDEETGLTGAANLGKGFLRSRILLNLDSEEEGALYVGCAGGRDTVATWHLQTEPAPAGSIPTMVRIGGLKGGHSGLEIDKGRGNAIKLLGRVLSVLDGSGARLVKLNGGNKRNAIPREAEAVVTIPADRFEAAGREVARLAAVFKAELASVDPGVSCDIAALSSPVDNSESVLVPSQQRQVLLALSALPHGVIRMSADIPGLVETSTNVGVVETTVAGDLVVATSQRSSVASEIDEICQSVASILTLAGASVRHSDGYPGWKPNLDSSILKIAVKAHAELFGKEPEVKAIHAGLECGIIGEKYPGIDMLSLGPTLEGVHSPAEAIHVDTVPRFWNYLLAILARL